MPVPTEAPVTRALQVLCKVCGMTHGRARCVGMEKRREPEGEGL